MKEGKQNIVAAITTCIFILSYSFHSNEMQLGQLATNPSRLSIFRDFPCEHGVVSFGSHSLAPHHAEPAAKPVKPQSVLPRALSVVMEGADEDESFEAGEKSEAEEAAATLKRGSAAPDADCSAAISGLEGFASAGLLPRPGACTHLLYFAQKTAGVVAHLDQVPFNVRLAQLEDAAAVHRLQGYLPDNAIHKRASLASLKRLIKNKASKDVFHWVAEEKGTLVAALVLGRCSGEAGKTALEIKLAAVHPALDERSEVFFALTNFVLQRLQIDPQVQELRLGNLKLGLEPDTILAQFVTAKSPQGKSESDSINSSSANTNVQVSRKKGSIDCADGGSTTTAMSFTFQREVAFSSGISLDDFIGWMAEKVSVARLTLESPGKKQIEKSKAANNGSGGPKLPSGRRRSKLTSIVEEARRLTFTVEFNDPGMYSCISSVFFYNF